MANIVVARDRFASVGGAKVAVEARHFDPSTLSRNFVDETIVAEAQLLDPLTWNFLCNSDPW